MPDHLSEVEQLILLAVLRLDEDAYGVAIRQEIFDRAGRRISAGGVYTVLARLEERGLVTSVLSEATHARGGRRRRLYRATPEGQRLIREAWAGLARLAEGVLRPSEGS